MLITTHAGAINNVGVVYLLGLGVSKDHAEAMKWFRKAVDKGHAGAMHNLGYHYGEQG